MIKAANEQRTIEYVITNKRVIEFRGDSKYIYKAMYLGKMLDVTLKINIVDRILGVGDITIYSDSNLVVTDKYDDEFEHYNKRANKHMLSADINKVIVLSDVKDSINLHSKLLRICQGNRDENFNFEIPKVRCTNCGTKYDNTKSRCPNCGAPNKE